ncbi:hypothetical protein [Dactylosporangium sp. NPDC048998]|uniref:hypothetical protein n=1 Tax=Dactylosporangium sp. NPDC048998 TaxID=3363976 RepID=UPI00370FB4F4
MLVGAGAANADPLPAPPTTVPASVGEALSKRPIDTLSPYEFRDLAIYLIAQQEKRKSLGLIGAVTAAPQTVASIGVSGTNVVSTGVTVDWPNVGVEITGELFRPDNSLSYRDDRYCSADHSCTYPTHYTDCTCQHGWWQLYVVGWQSGQASVADRADVLT